MLESFRAGDARPGTAKSPLWRITQVCTATGLSRSQILRMVKQNQFPQPVRPTERQPYWFASEVTDWQEALESRRDAAPAKDPPADPAPRRRGRPPGSGKK